MTNTKDEYGKTSLHWAAMNHNVYAARFLLEKGADIGTPDENGELLDD